MYVTDKSSKIKNDMFQKRKDYNGLIPQFVCVLFIYLF